MRRVLGLMTAMVLVFGGVSAVDLVAPAAAHATQLDPAQIRAEILERTNAHREAEGLPALSASARIGEVAQAWSGVQAAEQGMRHNPDYSTQIPAGWRAAGENVASGYPTAADVMTGWIGSSGHNANLLGDFTHIGIGVAVAADGTPYYTQVFAKYPGGVPGEDAPQPPLELSAGTPTISGAPKVGQTLSAAAGSWTPGTVFAYQWLRDGAAISGATAAKYSPTAADLGAAISVRVTGSQAGYASASKTSAKTAKVVVGTLTAPTPTVAGTVKVGQTLTAKPGAWTSGTSFTYQWLRNGAAIRGATKASYTLAAADAGKKVAVTLVGRKSGYTSATKTAAAKSVPLVITAGAPTISGTVKVGRTLTAKTGTWKPSGVRLAHQWLRNGRAITGATKSSYRLVASDAGQKVSVRVTGTKSGHASEARSSAAKSVPRVITAATPKISGSATIGSTLTAKPGAWKPAPVTLKYQWLRNGAAIKGATKASYKLVAGDRGKRITVRVTGTKSGHASEARTSKATAVVAYPSRTKPTGAWTCPSWAPIKGNASSKIFHVPGGASYSRTKPEECFSTARAAQSAGYRASKR